MGNKIASVAVLIVGGTIVADLVANYTGTRVLVDGIISLWSTSLSAVNPQAGASQAKLV